MPDEHRPSPPPSAFGDDRAPAGAGARGGAHRRSVWAKRLRVVGVVGLVVVLAVSLLQPLRVRAVAAATVADALDLPVPRPLATTVEVHERPVGGVTGDVYDPGGDAPAIVLIPGAAPDGRQDERVQRLARAVAGAGRLVFVPELEVYDQQLTTADVDRLVLATRALTDEDRGPAVLLGTSFGGALGLLAAADPRLEGRLAEVAVFGAYVDLLGVVQAASTGTSLVAGQRLAWEAHPDAEEIVRDRLLELLDEEERAAVLTVLDGEVEAGELPGELEAVHALLTHDDPARTYAIAEQLPLSIRERIAQVSPAAVASRIDTPVVAMHSTDDPAVPYGELVRLGEAIPHARLITLESFEHVDLEVESPRDWLQTGGDLLGAWRFATDVLAAQERWWP